jgi:hypothetical protein
MRSPTSSPSTAWKRWLSPRDRCQPTTYRIASVPVDPAPEQPARSAVPVGRMTSTSTARSRRGGGMNEHGQATVEYAILLSFALLFVIMPAFHLGLALSLREELRYAARQAAVAGADEPAVPQRCDTARATVPLILKRDPAEVRCSEPVGELEVYVRDPATPVGPFVFVTDVEVTAAAVTP